MAINTSEMTLLYFTMEERTFNRANDNAAIGKDPSSQMHSQLQKRVHWIDDVFRARVYFAMPQLKGKYASSNGNWTKDLDNSALRGEYLVKAESKVRISPVRESFSAHCYLQVSRALRIDLVKHRWVTLPRHRRGCHHNSMAGLTPLQQKSGAAGKNNNQ